MLNNLVRRAVGYSRVSTGEQAESGLGLDAQRSVIEKAVEAKGWELAALEVDAGVSGKSLRNRPALDAALRRLSGGEADALVVSKLDRLSRSVQDFAGLLAMAEKQGWAVVALDLGVDTSTPSGELVANVLASVAQWEAKTIGLRTKEAMAQAKARGVHCGRQTETPVEVERLIRALREQGMTYAAIATDLQRRGLPAARGGPTWHPSSVQRVCARRP